MKKNSKKTNGGQEDIAHRPFTQKELDAMGPWMRGIEGLPIEVQAAVRAIDEARKAGRPRVAKPKERMTLRLDQDVAAALRAKGKGWQTQLNAFLRAAMNEHRL
jgi:uncharacterized protein (DUF4415 family)